MKKSLLLTYITLLILGCMTFELSAQVGINNSNSKASSAAMLDISSTDKGLLIPRISTFARNNIPSPATGLIIYNTTSNLFNYYNGEAWYQIDTAFVSDIKGTNSAGGGVSISANQNKLPDNSAMLDASDPTRGVLIPRTTTTSINIPENGLIIYDISDSLLKYHFDGVWFPVCAASTGVQAGSGSQNPLGVAINAVGANPHQSAILDVSSTEKGVLIPRLTSANRNAMLPVPGLTIFNTDTKSIEYYNGTHWLKMNVMVPAGITISTNSGAICAGTTVTFTSSVTNGGYTPAYQWIVNDSPITGATNASFSYAPANNASITCQMTSSSDCATGNPAISNTIIMTVDPVFLVQISIEATASQICAGTYVTFTATPVNEGTDPIYQWTLNGNEVPGATSTTYTFMPENGDTIQCTLISSETCTTGNPAVSNLVIMVVNQNLPVSVTIAASANPVCANTLVQFTATPVNGGTTPQYQWHVNGFAITGATNGTYSYVPTNGNVVHCYLNSSETCITGNFAKSNNVTMTVDSLLPVSVVVAASANPVCAGTSVTFTATPANGGTTPAYQWKVNGSAVNGATNATYSFVPTTGNTILCVLTSSVICTTGNTATSNTVTMTVNPNLPVTVTIGASANPVCVGTTVTFTSTTTNGGDTPAFQWKVNGAVQAGATNYTYSYVPTNGNTISCIVTSSAICPTGNPAESNTITMTVNDYFNVSVGIAASANPVCAGASVTFTATPVNGGANPAYQWKVNGSNVSGATNSTYSYVPVHGNTILCVLTSGLPCTNGSPATSNSITMTVHDYFSVSVGIAASANPVCAGASVTYTATPVNGGTTPAYQWKVNGNNVSGATNSTYSYVPTHGNTIACILTSSLPCTNGSPATSNTITMTVNNYFSVSVGIAASANPVCAGASVTYTATPVNGGTAPAR
ncbi:MAG: hypothetical protein NTW16_15410 [Bacteroidetes bacterium]|nr:hypothetical protein [Bacteroidota bacterium]